MQEKWMNIAYSSANPTRNQTQDSAGIGFVTALETHKDTSNIQIEFLSIFQGSLSKFSTLREQNLSYTGRVGLIQYRVFDVGFLDFVSDDGEEGIEVQIALGRQLLSQMMSNFLPPFLISIMAFCTSFFDVSTTKI